MRKGLKIRLAGIAVTALLLGAPAALASPVQEIVGTGPPSPPVAVPEVSVESLPKPPVRVQVEPPAPPRVSLPPVSSPPVKPPVPPPAPEEQAATEAPVGAPSPSGPVDGLARSARGVVENLAGSSHSTGQADHLPLGTRATKGSSGQVPDTAAAPVVEPGRPAPVRRWLARVWPAVALGPFGELLSALPRGLEAIVGVSVPELRRVLVALQTGAGVGAGDRGGQPAPTVALQPSQPSPPPVAIPVGGAISVFVLLIASACLLALLLFAVRQELGALYRWWPH